MSTAILDELSEAERLILLRSYPLNSPQVRAELDRLTRLAACICETPVALVSIVEGDRQIFVGRTGTDLKETPREWSFCAHAMFEKHVMTVGNAIRDTRFADNPLVTRKPDIRFYAGSPLRSPEGAALG